MTSAEILAAIAASAELQALADAKSWTALAEAINALGLREPSAERIDTAKLMARMSITDCGAVLTTMATAAAANPVVAEALTQMRGPVGIDLSHTNAQAMIDLLFQEPLRGKVKLLGTKAVTVTAHDVEAAVGLQPVTTWQGVVTRWGTNGDFIPGVISGMVYAEMTFTANDGRVIVDKTWGDDLTPGRVAETIARRCESLQKADAALALFGG